MQHWTRFLGGGIEDEPPVNIVKGRVEYLGPRCADIGATTSISTYTDSDRSVSSNLSPVPIRAPVVGPGLNQSPHLARAYFYAREFGMSSNILNFLDVYISTL